MNRCSKIIVKGKVQNVNYRDFVKKCAKKLGIEGTIQNQNDESVVIYAYGLTEILENFIDLLYKGSSKSKVEDIIVEPSQQKKDFRGVFRIIGFK